MVSGNYEIFSNRATSHHAIGNYDAAVSDFSMAIQLKHNDSRLYLKRSIIYRDKPDIERSNSDINKAIEINPSFALTYTARAVSHFHNAEYNKVIPDLKKAIELTTLPEKNPLETPIVPIVPSCMHLAEMYKVLATAYGEISDIDSSLSNYGKAVELDPNNAEAHYLRAMMYLRNKEVRMALVSLDKSIELNQDNGETYFNRGYIVRRLTADNPADRMKFKESAKRDFHIALGLFKKQGRGDLALRAQAEIDAMDGDMI